jgi:hypothetical protein
VKCGMGPPGRRLHIINMLTIHAVGVKGLVLDMQSSV